jgi:Domain of unknown function (DUF397)
MTSDPDGFIWRKSSYSAGNGGCVEVGWRKSSYSASNGDCVEVGRWDSAEVRVRDTKNRTAGTLAFTAPPWRAFLTTLTALH